MAIGKGIWQVPFICSWVLFAIALFSWLRSHRDVDLEGASPTVIKDALAGIELSTDSRTFDSQTAGKMLKKLAGDWQGRNSRLPQSSEVTEPQEPDYARLVLNCMASLLIYPTEASMSLFGRAELLVLGLLRDAPTGLYGLDLVESSGGAIGRGFVYIILGNLEASGFVSARDELCPPRTALPRQLYKITALGERVLAAAELVGLTAGGGLSNG